MKAKEIYDFIQNYVPVSTQEKWDNSGLLVDAENDVKKCVAALDITTPCVEFAKNEGADLIISHHPVIFDPIKKISKSSPVWELVLADISAICLHTPFDMAKCGMNNILFNLFKNALELNDFEIFEPVNPDGTGFGFISEIDKKNITTYDLARSLKDILKCSDARYYDSFVLPKKIAVVSGSGASMLEEAKEAGVDTLITGDVKHDRWMEAANLNMNLVDLGHYYTENVCLPVFESLVKEADPSIEVERFEAEPYKAI